MKTFPIGTFADCYYPPDGRLKLAFWFGNHIFSGYKTDGVHSFLLGPVLPDGDQAIIEALSQGVTVGRLSAYEDVGHLRFYQSVGETEQQAAASWEAALRHEHDPYDIDVYGLIFFQASDAWLRNWCRPIEPEVLTNDHDRAEMCYELLFKAKEDAGVPILRPGTMGTPWAVKKALDIGRIKLIGEWK